MQNLTDRDMGYDLLYGTKSGALGYMEAVFESSSPRCREIFHRLHDDELRSQWRIWQFLHQRQEYRTEPAQRQEIEGIRQRMTHLCHTHEIGAGQAVGAGIEGGRWEGEAHSAGGYGSGAEGRRAARRADTQERWADGREGGRWDDREGRWSEGERGRESAYGLTGSTHGGPTTGNYAATGSTGGITFEPDRSMPEGTRFESERGFAETGGYAGSAMGTGTGATYGAGTTMGTGAAYGATAANYGTSSATGPSAGGRYGESAQGTAAHPGTGASAAWNDREGSRGGAGGRTGGVGIGARPSESSRRNFGENTWSSEETRRSGRY